MVEQTEGKSNSTCRHHWIIQPAFGLVKGVCRRCGEVREFDNYLEAPQDWRDLPQIGGDTAIKCDHTDR